MATWANWAGNITTSPARVAQPATIDEVQSEVRRAHARGWGVRVHGAGHSFSPVCATDGLLLDLSLISGVESVDPETGQATVLAGTKLHDVGEPLLAAGRALANQGDIDRQAIAGAVGTGTHGTGRKHGSFAAQLAGMEVVTPEGDLVWITERDGERFRAARLSLGMLGVATRVVMTTVPAYKLRERTAAMPFDTCMDGYMAQEERQRNAEFWWLPKLDTCVLKTFDESEDEPFHPEVVEAQPGTLERYLKPDAVDWGYRIYPSTRTVPFVEMEYTVPLAKGPAAMRAVRELMQTEHPTCMWAVEYRTQPGEDALLSPTQGQESVTISVHQTVEEPWEAFFRDAEEVFLAHGGRPHWGKLQYLEAARMARLYPTKADFEAVRMAMDPYGVFTNGFLREMGFAN